MSKYWRKLNIKRRQAEKIKLQLQDLVETTLDKEEILEWVSPLPKSTKTITVKAKYVGRAKPKLYYLETNE